MYPFLNGVKKNAFHLCFTYSLHFICKDKIVIKVQLGLIFLVYMYANVNKVYLRFPLDWRFFLEL